MPDLEKLRRFALAIALVHLAFVAAGVRLDPAETIKPLGIPLRITTPDLFGFVLLGASAYALLRFFFYAFLVEESPFAARRALAELLREAKTHEDGYRYVVLRSSNEAENWIRRVDKAIPGGHATTHLAVRPSYMSRDEHPGDVMRVMIPKRAKYLAWIQDIDFAAPIWVNLLAIGSSVATWTR